MTGTIENICYEYSQDVLFSQELYSNGCPVLIICYVQKKYLKELAAFLENHGYELTSSKLIGKHFALTKFSFVNFNFFDQILGDQDEETEI
jgi:hypothetical protein